MRSRGPRRTLENPARRARVPRPTIHSQNAFEPTRMTMPNEFEELARKAPPTLARQVLGFLLENKKWWLLPIVLVLGLVGLLSLVAGTGAAPFIYTMF